MYAIHEMLPFLTFPILISLLLLWTTYKSSQTKKIPPSPTKLPILGNLHQLSKLPHQDLHAMSRKHGPLMLLHFGRVPVLIVSSADAAREIMKTHDLTFASRPKYKAFEKLFYGRKDVAFAPHGEYWRQMKSIFVLQLLSHKRVLSFRSIREEETALFVRKIEESGGHVNLSEMFNEFANDLICRSGFGTKLRELENGKELLRMLEEFMNILGAISIGDFIPWLSWIDRVSGFDKKMERAAKAMDDFLEDVIQERIEASKGQGVLHKDGQSFIDILLEIQDENKVGASISRESIKALIVDVLAGGTDTIATTLGWAMTELLRNPTVLEKLQIEVREIAKDSRNISDDDIVKMHYLKAVTKETLRHHPPVPIPPPRVASKDATIEGYNISSGTLVMINVWTIGRDSTTWDDAEMFRPERFLESSIDFKGLHFEFIPFGAGRRGCPGITYSTAAMEYLLANIVQKFNWKLPNGAQGKDLDIVEAPGLGVHRANDLFALAIKFKSL